MAARNKQSTAVASRQNAPARPSKPPKTSDLTLPAGVAEFGIEKPMWLALTNLFPGAQWQSIVMAYEYCRARGLDVLKKPVHIVPMYVEDKATGQKGMQDVIMPGITETRITASRTHEYAGQDEAKLGSMIDIPVTNAVDAPANVKTMRVPESATITVYRLTGGKRFAYSHTEYFEEACARTATGLINSMWTKRPRGMLTKCAEAGALRKAFAEEVGGEMTAEEMMGQETFVVTESTVDHGASGIPEPEAATQQEAAAEPAVTEPASTEPAKDDVVDAEFTEAAGPDAQADGVTQALSPEQIRAARAAASHERMMKGDKAEPEATKPKAEEPPVETNFKIDLPDGARGVVTRQMTEKGITEPQLLAKMGSDINITNINQALGLIKGWE